MKLTGGCQCGAIRYAFSGLPSRTSICHCRMCQKAAGSFGMILANVALEAFAWTRGKPSEFASTPVTRRGFCNRCGTPLYLQEDGDQAIELCVGTLDQPHLAPPAYEVGTESKLPWFETVTDLPGRTTEQDRTPQELARLTSNQHPDHDTGEN